MKILICLFFFFLFFFLFFVVFFFVFVERGRGGGQVCVHILFDVIEMCKCLEMCKMHLTCCSLNLINQNM